MPDNYIDKHMYKLPLRQTSCAVSAAFGVSVRKIPSIRSSNGMCVFHFTKHYDNEHAPCGSCGPETARRFEVVRKRVHHILPICETHPAPAQQRRET